MKLLKLFFAVFMLACAISAATLVDLESASDTVVCLIGFAFSTVVYCIFDMADDD